MGGEHAGMPLFLSPLRRSNRKSPPGACLRRNHAILAGDAHWRLSPAYDLTPSTPLSLERRDLALKYSDHGRLTSARNLLSQCRRFLLRFDDAKRILVEW